MWGNLCEQESGGISLGIPKGWETLQAPSLSLPWNLKVISQKAGKWTKLRENSKMEGEG